MLKNLLIIGFIPALCIINYFYVKALNNEEKMREEKEKEKKQKKDEAFID